MNEREKERDRYIYREREKKTEGDEEGCNQGQERITFNETNRQNHKTMLKTLYRK